MAAGKTYGVAQKAIVYSVRVLDCGGRGSYSVVIDGVNHAVSHANETGRRGIISMSLGGPTSLTLNAALRNAIAAGVPAVVAAGNEYSNACTRSPASVTEAITVGSSTINDDASSFLTLEAVWIFLPQEVALLVLTTYVLHVPRLSVVHQWPLQWSVEQ